jgi:hypothetical protein
MNAADLDAQLRALAAERAADPTPHPALPPSDPTQLYTLDNLLWDVRPAADAPMLELCFFHPGLGWMRLALSRGQVEDLHTAVEFAVHDMQIRYNPSVAITGNNAP